MRSQTLTLVVIGTPALAGAAYGQVPVSNDTSDSTTSNTRMGPRALGDSSLTGTHNTASGYEALFQNSSSSDNTADGYNALAVNTLGGTMPLWD